MFRVIFPQAFSTARLFALFLAFAGVSFGARSSQAAPMNLGNILPLGDSITDGVGAAGGYRDPLYSKLTAAGYTFTYVGSQTDNPGNLPSNQTHHEGHSGYVIQSRDPNDTSANASGRPGILDNINSYIGAGSASPNYILLMIGTNDIDIDDNVAPAGDGYYASNAGNRLSALISAISNKGSTNMGLAPNAHLIVAQIVPTTDAAENQRVQAFNSKVASVVGQHAAIGENVSLVDMYDALQPNSTDFADKLHPNSSGYNKMADVWLAGIEAVPEPTSMAMLGIAGLILVTRRRSR